MTDIDPIELAKQRAPSPCQGICRLDSRRDQCIACYRFRKDVGIWRALSEEDKFRIIKEIPERYEEYKAFIEQEGVLDGFPEELYPVPDRILNRQND